MILGLDLSLTATGWCKLYDNTDGPDGFGHYETGVITIPDATHHIAERLHMWSVKLHAVMVNQPVDGIYIEAIGGTQHGAVKLGMVHALFWRAITARFFGYSVATEINASTLKMHATGNGSAKKAQVLAEAVRRLGYTGHDDNEADALWLADLGARLHGYNRPQLPATHLRALDKLKPKAA